MGFDAELTRAYWRANNATYTAPVEPNGVVAVWDRTEATDAPDFAELPQLEALEAPLHAMLPDGQQRVVVSHETGGVYWLDEDVLLYAPLLRTLQVAWDELQEPEEPLDPEVREANRRVLGVLQAA